MAGPDSLPAWIAAVRSSRSPTAPLIAFSRDPQAKARALSRGASGFLEVPCRPEGFTALVGTWLRMHRLTQRAGASSMAVPALKLEGATAATILVVDDSAVVHKFVRETLKGTGHRLVHAYDGVEGLAAAQKSVPDLVLSDLDMPNMDGFEMCRRLRLLPATRTVPIIILSARGQGLDVDRSRAAGANDFLSKPVSEKELRSRIERLLGPAFTPPSGG